MKRVAIILAVVCAMVLVAYGVLYWAYGDFARGVIEDAKNHPMHQGADTIVVNGDTLTLTTVE
jgi:hypothetical protein